MSTQKLTGTNISFFLALLATLILFHDITYYFIWFQYEIGIWDSLSRFWNDVIIYSYPVVLIISFLLYLLNKESKGKYDIATIVLLISNGIILLFIILLLLLIS